MYNSTLIFFNLDTSYILGSISSKTMAIPRVCAAYLLVVLVMRGMTLFKGTMSLHTIVRVVIKNNHTPFCSVQFSAYAPRKHHLFARKFQLLWNKDGTKTNGLFDGGEEALRALSTVVAHS